MACYQLTPVIKMNSIADNESSVPQWKKELILRLRARSSSNYCANSKQLSGRGPPDCSSDALGCVGHQPSLTSTSCGSVIVEAASVGVGTVVGKCNTNPKTCSTVHSKMVQERVWVEHKQIYDISAKMANGDHKNMDLDTSEELKYGPGIVSKLKNRYLSLTLRETNAKVRPSILPLRKATSLENLLDDDDPNDKLNHESNRQFESRMNGTNGNSKNVSNRYRNTVRRTEIKRARSVETISRTDHILLNDTRPKRESMHEDVFIIDKEGNDKSYNRKIPDINKLENTTETKFSTNNIIHSRINRPKRIAPVMNEREKPPADVVKQTKKIFESRPELRTKPPQQTGDVAAKVATYKSIIIQTKISTKPPIKQKPVLPTNEKVRKTSHPPVRLPVKSTRSEKKENKTLDLTSPVISNNVESSWKQKVKSPDIASLPSPIPDVSMINDLDDIEKDRKITSSLSETPDLILHSSPIRRTNIISATEDFLIAEKEDSEKPTSPLSPLSQTSLDSEDDFQKIITLESQERISQASNSVTFNFHNHNIPKVVDCKVPPTQELKLEINGLKPIENLHNNTSLLQTNVVKTSPVVSPKTVLSPREIEKNFINASKSKEQNVITSSTLSTDNDEQKCEVPKPKRSPRAKTEEQTCVVFKFTDRKDVPDYVGNDGTVRTGRIELPKIGEGGITLLPGASIDESYTDYDEELISLEGPPSPCDVNFINDNILIDGKSSLCKRNKESKMRIQFVEAVPQIFEYPSEASMLLDVEVQSPQQPISSSMGHTVPSLLGSTLANYTPKSGYTVDDFQFELGVTQPPPPEIKNEPQIEPLEEIEEPVLFSSGTNSDILF